MFSLRAVCWATRKYRVFEKHLTEEYLQGHASTSAAMSSLVVDWAALQMFLKKLAHAAVTLLLFRL